MPRKPKIYGEQVSRLFFRYSCQHKLFCLLHQSFRSDFTGEQNALLPIALNVQSRSFGNVLEPRYIFGAESLDQ